MKDFFNDAPWFVRWPLYILAGYIIALGVMAVIAAVVFFGIVIGASL